MERRLELTGRALERVGRKRKKEGIREHGERRRQFRREKCHQNRRGHYTRRASKKPTTFAGQAELSKHTYHGLGMFIDGPSAVTTRSSQPVVSRRSEFV
jgi:hypothetical protein